MSFCVCLIVCAFVFDLVAFGCVDVRASACLCMLRLCALVCCLVVCACDCLIV